MKKFEWILTEDLYLSALSALSVVGAPVAMHDRDGCGQRFTATAYDGGVDIIREKKFTDTRGCEAWSGVDAVAFLPDGFHLRSMGDLALLSLALHAASANCTDSDGKPHTLDGVTTARLDDVTESLRVELNVAYQRVHNWTKAAYDIKAHLSDGVPFHCRSLDKARAFDDSLVDLDLSCSLDGCSWTGRDGGDRFVLARMGPGVTALLAEVVRQAGEWVALVSGKLPGIGGTSLREAMDDAEATLLDDAKFAVMASDSEPSPGAPRCPLHECANGDRACGRESYDREACAKTVQETVVPPERPAIEVVDVTPTASYADRVAKCIEMIPRISRDALPEIEQHLAAIVEIEAGE